MPHEIIDVEQLRHQKSYFKVYRWATKRLFFYELEISQGYPKLGTF